jgi:PAS domain S-box-containing protein
MESAKAFDTGEQLIEPAGSEISTLSAAASSRSAVASVFPQHLRLTDGTPEGMIATDDAGTIVYANPAEERTFGFGPGELIGMHLADLSGYPDEENDQHVREVFSDLQSKGFWSGDWLNMSRDGTRFYSTVSMHTAKLDGRMYFIRVHSAGTLETNSQAAAYHLAALVESSDDAIIGRDLNGLIISWNSAAERIFGYSADEAIGRPLTILAVPGREDEMPTIFERIRKGESVKQLETVRRRKDSKEIDVSITGSPIRNAAGAVIGASTIARDIKDCKGLEEVTLRLAAIVDGSDDAIVSKDLNGIIRSWNKAAEHIFGYSSAEVIGQPISILAAPDRLNEMPEVLAKLRRGEQIDHYETRRKRKDGKVIDISLTVSPIRTSSGRVIGASKIARDISERKRSQKALEEANIELRQSETQFRTLANAIPQLCWMAHADGSFFWFNDRWYEYTGMVRDQNEGLAWQTMHDPVTLHEMTERWEAAVVSREPFEMVTRICGQTGAFRSFLTRALPLKDHGGRVVRWFGTSTDIEERKLVEDALEKTNETLQRANADLAQFAYVAAHDLQEPLRTVVSFSQIVQRTCSNVLDPETAQNLEYVVNGARRMNQLISDLLSYSRTTGETGHADEEVDLEEAFGAILTLLKEPIESANASITHQPLPRIFADASQMGQVFQNLLSNALKYHRDGVTPEIEVKVERDDGNWLFSVRDNGQGFKMKYAQQIFGIFKRLHGKEVPGSGVGLAICKAVIERHGGHIWANSEVGHGTTFYFTVPNRTGKTNATQQVT